MTWEVEFAEDAVRDFALIFEHLTDSYQAFGESRAEAREHAATRLRAIRQAVDRIATAPHRGTRRDDILPGVRHLTIARAIYWFDVDEAARRIRILAVFFGGQDHTRHMLLRLLRDRPIRD